MLATDSAQKPPNTTFAQRPLGLNQGMRAAQIGGVDGAEVRVRGAAQPTDEIGCMAAGRLIERLHGLKGPAREMLLPGQLQVRGSSAAAEPAR